MKLPKLKKRLQTICDMIETPKHVVDVGCDHGYLAVYLAMKKDPTTVIASDVNTLPIQRAKVTVEKYGQSEKVELRLSDGLEEIAHEEADTVVIAGMGGELICKILTNWSHYKSPEITYYLQPMTHHKELRSLLFFHGFTILQEIAVEENQKHYTVMKVAYVGEVPPFPEEYFYGGLHLDQKDKDSQGYLDHVIFQMKTQIEGMRKGKENLDVLRLEKLLHKVKERRYGN